MTPRRVLMWVAGIAGGGIAVLLASVGLATMIGWASHPVSADRPDRPRQMSESQRVARCREVAAANHVAWYYTDAEGCVGRGVFGVHVPLDIDSPNFHY